jgi:hypothetical protein
MKTHYVHDYETMVDCFVAVFEDYKKDDTRVFVVSNLSNDIVPLLAFLRDNLKYDQWHISYNGLNFDSQITQYILINAKRLAYMQGGEIAAELYGKAQDAIARKNAGEFLEYNPKDLLIKQIDVFRLNHWDNKAKLSSLKWIQYMMDWDNIVDMPLHHTHSITTQEEQDMVVMYCINDVRSTKEIMNRSTELIRLRKTLSEEYKLDLYSASETKISKELFLMFLSKKTGIKKYQLRQMRTIRERIVVKDLLLSYITFKRPEFQQLHEAFKRLIINPENTKGVFKHTVKYRGVNTDYALGGLHGARKAGIYEAKDGMIIMTSDVTSFYPNLIIRNQWSPAHIPKLVFCEQYEWFFDERRKIPKKDPKNYVYKIILNATYGLSNEKDSFLYDPELTMRVTINGQLSLTMLYEMLAEGIPGAIPLMQNTDGLEMMIPEEYKGKYLEICAEWERITSLELEHDQYQKMIIGDVNNYIAVNNYKEVAEEEYNKLKTNPHNLLRTVGDKYYHAPVKCKGRFEFEYLPLHKNKSHLIVRKAIYHYFLNGTPPEEYLQNNRNIMDYCAGVKIKGNWQFIEHAVVNGEVIKTPLQKTLRYYISNTGSKVIKTNKGDGREIQLESGRWYQTPFNKYENKEWDTYDLNDQYYLECIRKEQMNIVPHLFETQLKLF